MISFEDILKKVKADGSVLVVKDDSIVDIHSKLSSLGLGATIVTVNGTQEAWLIEPKVQEFSEMQLQIIKGFNTIGKTPIRLIDLGNFDSRGSSGAGKTFSFIIDYVQMLDVKKKK